MTGVSFIVRVHNEEATLERALQPLRDLTIPYEILVILDRCTDRSEDIARRCQTDHEALRVVTSQVPLSRAGVETLITSRDSAHSLATYNTKCFRQARYNWKFKYDADFIASSTLIEYLNTGELFADPSPRRVRLPCQWDGISNNEEYLANCLERFAKYIFWEVPVFSSDTSEMLDLPIEHVSTLRDLKAYWTSPPWFVDLDTPEAKELQRRYSFVISKLGPEPVGMARASNPECDNYYRHVLDLQVQLAEQGISFVE